MKSVFDKNMREAKEVIQSLIDLRDGVETAAGLVAEALGTGHKLLACGNGGSAMEAAHLTTEFVCRFTRDRRPYPAICLTTHGGDLTAISNDYAFDEVFSRQVEAFAHSGDVLIVLTTSGDSENIRRALEMAAKKQVKTIALLGRDGGKVRGLANIELIVPSNNTARIQEAHLLLLHTMCEIVELQLQSVDSEVRVSQ